MPVIVLLRRGGLYGVQNLRDTRKKTSVVLESPWSEGKGEQPPLIRAGEHFGLILESY